MTRTEAKMIAEELYKLMEKDSVVPDTYLTKKEASEMYNIPMSHFDHYGKKYLKVPFGRSFKYSKNYLDSMLRNNLSTYDDKSLRNRAQTL